MQANWLRAHPEYTPSTLSFQDLGKSGWSGAHLENAFGRLLAAVESGVIKKGDVILIEAIDRAGRMEPLEMLQLLAQIVKADVALITLSDGYVYDRASVNGNQLFMLVGKIQQAFDYSENLSGRLKRKYEQKRQDAREGKGTTLRGPMWLDKGKLDESLAPFIVQAFEAYADGLGERRIMSRIRGKHPKLENLSASTIKKWLRMPVAIGRWGDIENAFPAVISRELWYRCQKRLESGERIKSASNYYVLTGLVKCGLCNKNFGVLKSKVSGTNMFCMTRHALGPELGCPNGRSMPLDVLEFIRNKTMLPALQRAQAARSLTVSERRLVEIEGELGELVQQEANTMTAYVKWGESPSLVSEMNRVKSSIKALEDERITLQSSPAEPTVSATFSYFYSLVEGEKMNAILQDVGYQIVCNGRDILVNEPAVNGEGNQQAFVYVGWSRSTDCYRVLEVSTNVEHQLLTTHSKERREAENISTQIL
jgi:DNA invertase Pin-like site-specific DNA recombinase